jgi:ribosome maturation protein SDO1
VLQIQQVFSNVSKGAVAPHADLQKSFGPKSTTESIILEILSKGELQVGEKERNAKLEMIHTEVVSIVASKCVDPESKRVYTASMIEKALAELSARRKEETEDEAGAPRWSGVTDKKSPKAQALEAIKALVHHQPIAIARARMRLRVVAPKRCKDKIMEFVEEVEDEGYDGGDWECTAFVEPGKYKGIMDLVGAETKGKGRVEVLDTAVRDSLSDGFGKWLLQWV